MSVLIRGMEMPSECGYCPLCRYFSSVGVTICMVTQATLAEGYKTIRLEGRHKDCPLVELPEKHGRLIDADALIAKRGILEVDSENIVELSPGWTIPLESVIDIEPTIVEAEGE